MKRMRTGTQLRELVKAGHHRLTLTKEERGSFITKMLKMLKRREAGLQAVLLLGKRGGRKG